MTIILSYAEHRPHESGKHTVAEKRHEAKAVDYLVHPNHGIMVVLLDVERKMMLALPMTDCRFVREEP